jgi:hypothetical protein
MPAGIVGCATCASGAASAPLSSAHDRQPPQTAIIAHAVTHFPIQRFVPVALAMSSV